MKKMCFSKRFTSHASLCYNEKSFITKKNLPVHCSVVHGPKKRYKLVFAFRLPRLNWCWDFYCNLHFLMWEVKGFISSGNGMKNVQRQINEWYVIIKHFLRDAASHTYDIKTVLKQNPNLKVIRLQEVFKFDTDVKI